MRPSDLPSFPCYKDFVYQSHVVYIFENDVASVRADLHRSNSRNSRFNSLINEGFAKQIIRPLLFLEQTMAYIATNTPVWPSDNILPSIEKIYPIEKRY